MFLSLFVCAACSHFVIFSVCLWVFCYVCLGLFELLLQNYLTSIFYIVSIVLHRFCTSSCKQTARLAAGLVKKNK